MNAREAEESTGVRFRRFRDDSDFEAMAKVSFESWKADRVDFVRTREDYERSYAAGRGGACARPLLAEVDGEVVGFVEMSWARHSSGTRIYSHLVHLLPEHRKAGLRRRMLGSAERTLAELARSHPDEGDAVLQSWAMSEGNDWMNTLTDAGYRPAWHVLEMVRPDLDEIPEVPLPEGVAVRPVTEDDYRKVWEASKAMFMREPWSSEEEWGEARYREWLEAPRFMPELWQIAWDGEEVAGSVQSYILEEENRAFDRRRGHTETIFVAPAWRGKGLARALIARSLRTLKERGMEEATLDTEAENVHEAFRVYEGMGYQTVSNFTIYRKPMLAVRDRARP